MTKMAATRDGYGDALLELASNPKVVVLEADLGKSTKSLHFRKAHPERTVSCGIGEQNMLLVGAGLASSGYIPFASTFAAFLNSQPAVSMISGTRHFRGSAKRCFPIFQRGCSNSPMTKKHHWS